MTLLSYLLYHVIAFERYYKNILDDNFNSYFKLMYLLQALSIDALTGWGVILDVVM